MTDFMLFMEQMGTNEIAIVAAFFIGLMTAISPCPLTTNITAIAYTSKRIHDRRHTLTVASLYTLGRMLTYAGIASMIVYAGLSTQHISLFLQSYGERLLGPILLVIGLVMLEAVKFGGIAGGSERIEKLKKRLAKRGLLGAFLLGAVFALAFCPFSAVLYFGMLIPLSLAAGDGIVLPSVFAVATGLPVIILSLLLTMGVSTLGKTMNRIQVFEKWMRKSVGIVFIAAGVYYICVAFLSFTA